MERGAKTVSAGEMLRQIHRTLRESGVSPGMIQPPPDH